jgi:hypothetical protein
MKRLAILYILLILNSLKSFSQPAGNLYIHSHKLDQNDEGILGYITYPGSVYSMIDSTDAEDFIIIGDSIYLANENVYIYNLQTDLLEDSIITDNSRHLARWNNQLISLSFSNPYFNVYDLSTYALIYSLDDLKVSYSPHDFLISGNHAFLLLSDSIIVIDLLQQDTLIKFQTPHPFSFAGQNLHIVERNEFLYVDVTYATHVPRFSLLKLDKTTFNVTTAFHFEGDESMVKPVVAGDSIYMCFYNSHYNILQDTFLHAMSLTLATEYDSISQSLFIYTYSSNEVSYVSGGTPGGSTTIPNTFNKMVFKHDITNDVENDFENSLMVVSPQPFSNTIKINMNKNIYIDEIYIHNIKGQAVFHQPFQFPLHSLKIDAGNFPPGMYVVSVLTDGKVLNKKAIRISTE